MLSCNVGEGPWVQQFANEMGIPVEAAARDSDYTEDYFRHPFPQAGQIAASFLPGDIPRVLNGHMKIFNPRP